MKIGGYLSYATYNKVVVYDEKDVRQFRPSYEYIVSRERKSCPQCRSLIYNNNSDIKPLSLLDLIIARHNPSFYNNDTPIDSILKATQKVFDVFGAIKNDQIKSTRNQLLSSLKVTDKILELPTLHRCNKCLYAWNIHMEMKQRIFVVSHRLFSTSDLWFTLYLPKIENFYNGLVLLNESSESEVVNKHVLDIKKMFLNNNGISLTTARKNISAGDFNSAIINVVSFTALPENKFFYNSALQLQARYASFSQERIRGTLSHQEATLQQNKISNDLIDLIEEINKYKQM